MRILHSVRETQNYLNAAKQSFEKIGFVPTMGALHEGHLSLINIAKENCSIVVCSIFVNPTQFDDPNDLEKYPRNLEKDAALLKKAGCNLLFAPSAKEVYPSGLDTSIDLDFSALSTMMEGAFREGHFEGMAQVVKRLLDIVQPTHLFMGQKDFQQFTIVNYMLKSLEIPTELVVCPIVRESDGLAMSSRNVRLDPQLRPKAKVLNETLRDVKKKITKVDIPILKKEAFNKLKLDQFRPEYFEIIDGDTLLPVTHYDDSEYIVACTAVWVGDIRLIDNMILKP